MSFLGILKKMILLLCILIPSVWSCPSTTTTTTTTPPPKTHPAMNFSHNDYITIMELSDEFYPYCPKFFSSCMIAYLTKEAIEKLEANASLRFRFEVSRDVEMYLEKNNTFKLEFGSYLSYFTVSTDLNPEHNSC